MESTAAYIERRKNIAHHLLALDSLMQGATLDEFKWIHGSVIAATRMALQDRGELRYHFDDPVYVRTVECDRIYRDAIESLRDRG